MGEPVGVRLARLADRLGRRDPTAPAPAATPAGGTPDTVQAQLARLADRVGRSGPGSAPTPAPGVPTGPPVTRQTPPTVSPTGVSDRTLPPDAAAALARVPTPAAEDQFTFPGVGLARAAGDLVRPLLPTPLVPQGPLAPAPAELPARPTDRPVSRETFEAEEGLRDTTGPASLAEAIADPSTIARPVPRDPAPVRLPAARNTIGPVPDRLLPLEPIPGPAKRLFRGLLETDKMLAKSALELGPAAVQATLESLLATVSGVKALADAAAETPDRPEGPATPRDPLAIALAAIGQVASQATGGEAGRQALETVREDVQGFFRPETPVGAAAGVVSRIGADLAQFMTPGIALRLAARGGPDALLAARVIDRLRATEAGRQRLLRLGAVLDRIAEPATLRGRILQNIALGAPLDAAFAASAPENSLVAFLATATGSPALTALSESVGGRAAVDVLLNAGLTGIVEKLLAGRRLTGAEEAQAARASRNAREGIGPDPVPPADSPIAEARTVDVPDADPLVPDPTPTGSPRPVMPTSNPVVDRLQRRVREVQGRPDPGGTLVDDEVVVLHREIRGERDRGMLSPSEADDLIDELQTGILDRRRFETERRLSDRITGISEGQGPTDGAIRDVLQQIRRSTTDGSLTEGQGQALTVRLRSLSRQAGTAVDRDARLALLEDAERLLRSGDPEDIPDARARILDAVDDLERTFPDDPAIAQELRGHADTLARQFNVEVVLPREVAPDPASTLPSGRQATKPIVQHTDDELADLARTTTDPVDRAALEDLARRRVIDPPVPEPVVRPRVADDTLPVGERLAPSAVGRQGTVVLPEGGEVPVTYAIVDAADLIPSHDPFTFGRNPRFPDGVQPRRYDVDPAAQGMVIRIESDLDPRLLHDPTVRATEGPVLIDPTGRILGGTNRYLGTVRAYAAQGPAAARLRAALPEAAATFGIDAVPPVGRPVLVRIVDLPEATLQSRRALADLMAALNDVSTKAADPLADATVRAAKLRLADQALARLADVAGDESLRGFLRTAGGRAFLTDLVDAGVISRAELARFVGPDGITAEGATTLERTLLAAAIDDIDIHSAAPASILAKLDTALPALLAAQRVPGYSLTPVLQRALVLQTRRAGSVFGSLDDLLAQTSFLDRTEPDEVILFAKLLDRPKREIVDRFREYASLVGSIAREQANPSLLDLPAITPEDAFTRTLLRDPDPALQGVLMQTLRQRSDAHLRDHATRVYGSEAVRDARIADLVENSDEYLHDGEQLPDPFRQIHLEVGTELDALGDPPVPRMQAVGRGVRGASLNLIGQKLRLNVRDLQRAFYSIRNPKYESIAFVGRDSTGRVVSQMLVSSGVIDLAQADLGRAIAKAKRAGAVRLVVSHNHPSGDIIPSSADKTFTERLDLVTRQYGITLDGHVVIDGDRITVIRIQEGLLARTVDTQHIIGRPAGSGPQDWTSGVLADGLHVTSSTIADAVRRLGLHVARNDPQLAHVVYLDTQLRVVAVEPHHVDALARGAKWLEQRRRGNAAQKYVIVMADPGNTHMDAVIRAIEPRLARDALRVTQTRRLARQLGRQPTRRELADAGIEILTRTGESVRNLLDVYNLSTGGTARGLREFGILENVDVDPPRGGDRAFIQRPTSPTEPGFAMVEQHRIQYGPHRSALPEEGERRIPGTGVPAPRISQILKDLSTSLGVPIRTGRLGAVRRSTLGFFIPEQRVIRTRFANDIEVTAHEVGHFLHELLWGVRANEALNSTPLRPWHGELIGLTVGVKPHTAVEGMAEFVRRYVTNPDAARRRAPQFFAMFEQRLQQDFPEALQALRDARDQYEVFLDAGPHARVEAGMRLEAEQNHPTVIQRLQKFETAIVDDLAPVERLVKGLLGDNPDVLDDVATLMRVSRGAADVVEEFIQGASRRFGTGEVVGPGLEQIFEPITAARQLRPFRRYGVARRTLELNRRGIQTQFTPADAETIVRDLDSPLFRQVWGQWQTFNRQLIQYLVDAKVILPETGRQMIEQNQDYLPFFRVDKQGSPGAALSRFGEVITPIHRIKGGFDDLRDPYEGIIQNIHTFVNAAFRQRAMSALVRLTALTGSGKLITEVKPNNVKLGGLTLDALVERLRGQGTSDETLDLLVRDLLDPNDPNSLEDIISLYTQGTFSGQENVLTYLDPDTGRRRWFEVDPELYQAFKGLEGEETSGIVRFLEVFSRTLRLGATTFSVDFPVRNMTRDVLTQFIVSEYGFKPWDAVVGMTHMFADTPLFRAIGLGDAEIWGLFRASGGGKSTLTGLDRKGLRGAFERFINERTPLENVTRSPAEALRLVNDAFERATKVGEFARALAAQPPPRTPRDRERNLLRAAASGRDGGIDFARHGSRTKGVRLITAFWNARVQGYDRIVRAFQKDPTGVAGRIAVSVTLPSTYLYHVNRDNPDYWEVPQWQRDLFWLVPIGRRDDGTTVFARIPKPFELGVIFGSLPERILEAWDTQDPVGLQESITRFGVEQISGLAPIPTAFVPLIEYVSNKSLFRNRPLVPRGLERLPPAFQATASTSEVAVGIGRMLNLPPAKIDNLIFGYTASAGRLVVDAADALLRSGRDRRIPSDPLGPFRENTPLVRAFIVRRPGGQSASVERFYRRLQATSVAKAAFDSLIRQGDDAGAQAWLDQYQEEIAEYDGLREVADLIAGMRAQIALFRRDVTLDDAALREQVRSVEEAIVTLAQTALDRRRPGFRVLEHADR